MPSRSCSIACPPRHTWGSRPGWIRPCLWRDSVLGANCWRCGPTALRFTSEEARSFFAERMGLALSDSDVETLVARTEGWPAVLQLAGLSLAGRADVSGYVRGFAATNRFVLDFIAEEVLGRLEPDVQRVPPADVGARPAHRTTVRRAHRQDGRPGHARASRAVQPAHRAPRRRAPLVPLSPAVRGPAARPSRGRAPGRARRAAPSRGRLVRTRGLRPATQSSTRCGRGIRAGRAT